MKLWMARLLSKIKITLIPVKGCPECDKMVGALSECMIEHEIRHPKYEEDVPDDLHHIDVVLLVLKDDVFGYAANHDDIEKSGGISRGLEYIRKMGMD